MRKSEIVNRNKVQSINSLAIGGLIKSKLTLTNITKSISSSGNLAFGFKLCNIGAEYHISKVIVDINYQCTDAAMSTTPVFGIGTTEATGAVNDLLGMTTCINIVDVMIGQPFNGTTIVPLHNSGHAIAFDPPVPQVYQAGDIYLNVAGNWTDPGTLTFNGKVIILWCSTN